MPRIIRDWRGIKYDLDKLTDAELESISGNAIDIAVETDEFIRKMDNELRERRRAQAA